MLQSATAATANMTQANSRSPTFLIIRTMIQLLRSRFATSDTGYKSKAYAIAITLHFQSFLLAEGDESSDFALLALCESQQGEASAGTRGAAG